jgi:beta-barrel assembly-enhancing protease
MRSRYIILALLLALCAGAFYYTQLHRVQVVAGPQAIVNAVAETQRELSRVPMKVTRMSDAEEIRIGNELANRYLSSRPPASATDQLFEKYVQEIGSRLGARANRKLPYQFHYVADAHFFNAFALPGGHIFFGKGLALAMSTEDELAAILGHEIEHVDQYHCAELYQIEARLRHIPLGSVVNLPVRIFQAGYTKEQEFEADRQGTLLAMKSGYSPHGAVEMFEHFENIRRRYATSDENPPAEMTRVASEVVRDYFRSHPLPQERKQRIEQLISSMNRAPIAEKPLQVSPR